LSTAQRSEVAEKLLKARPDLSDRAIAKTAQVDHTTVASKRRKLEAGGEIHHPTKRTGRDGKAQSATKTKARASPDTTALADPASIAGTRTANIGALAVRSVAIGTCMAG
jgi:hypothetical protein